VTETVLATIDVAVFDLTVTDDAVWVADYWSNQVVRIDPATNQVVAQIEFTSASGILEGPRQVAVGAGGVWVTTRFGDALVRIDPATNQIVASIKQLKVYGSQAMVSSPYGVVVDATGVWLTGGNASGLYLVDPATNQQIGAMPMPPSFSLIVSDGSLWVEDHAEDTVTRVDPSP
jgi:YVTN family beta-propeller protein